MQHMNTDAKILSGLLQEGECVSSYVLSGEYWCRYCITPDKDLDRIDLSGALEETLHRLLDFNFSEEAIERITGMIVSDDPDHEGIDIDLGYYLPTQGISHWSKSISYDEAIKEWKTYIIRSYTPGNVTIAVTFASCEEMALRMMEKEYPCGTGWYAQELEVGDGLTVLV